MPAKHSSCLIFPDIQDPNYCKSATFLFNLADFVYKNKYIIAAFGVVSNTFHMIILTRKSMRSNCINFLMIAVSICDLYNMSVIINMKFRNSDECTLPKSYSMTIVSFIVEILDTVLRRLSSWIGVVMALIRLFAIKYPLSPSTDGLSKPVFALKFILGLFSTSVIVSLAYWVHFSIETVAEWVAPEHCGLPNNFTAFLYGNLQSNFSVDHPLALQIPQTADAVSQILLALTLPVLTFLLIKELRKTESNRNKVLMAKKGSKSSKTDHTTKMIMLMTVASTLAEGPIGLIIIVQMFAGQSLTTITANLNVIFGAIVALNTITHCLVCLVISSQYRKTVVEIVSCKKHVNRQRKITPNSSVSTLKK